MPLSVLPKPANCAAIEVNNVLRDRLSRGEPHEYVDGHVHLMAGARAGHGHISQDLGGNSVTVTCR